MTARDCLAQALIYYDAACDECPVKKGYVPFKGICPKCRAPAQSNCGPEVKAALDVVEAARVLLDL